MSNNLHEEVEKSTITLNQRLEKSNSLVNICYSMCLKPHVKVLKTTRTGELIVLELVLLRDHRERPVNRVKSTTVLTTNLKTVTSNPKG